MIYGANIRTEFQKCLHFSQIGDDVSVYADLSGTCKRGFLKQFIHPRKLFIGNGVLRQNRSQIFAADVVAKGLAVEMKCNIAKCPNINDKDLWNIGALLQNLPSIVCGHVLNPQPGEIVLDMCAAPGNKTTHLATLIQNKGIVIALEKVKSKIENLKERCKIFGADCVHVYQFDSTKCFDPNIISRVSSNQPPYPKEMFDKILLDAPCSGLGQRPQLGNKMTVKELKSYVPLQRKLFEAAVNLLKPNGRLVYSTCTITLAENEQIVEWALRTFPNLKLIPSLPKIGGANLKTNLLTEEQRNCLQRFSYLDKDTELYSDSVGFFIAHFEKINS